jgi:protein O-GlcNAc transferase
MIPVPHAIDLARRYYQAGQLQQAEQLCREILQADAGHAGALHLAGLIAARTGRHDLACDYLNEALRLEPDFADAQNILGIVSINQRKPAEAVGHFREAVRLNPDFAVAHTNLGNALREQGDLDAAVVSFREAVRLKPDLAEAHNNLGNALQKQGRLDEAEVCLRQALHLRPDHAEVAYNLGILLWKRDRVEEAITCNRQAVRLKPDYVEAHLNLGHDLMENGQLDDAISAYRTSVRLKPDAAHIHSHLVRILHYHPDYDPRAIREECRHWDSRHAAPLGKDIRPHTNLPDPDRRLRIGYVSPDFREHADAFFLVPLLANHDHGRFEIVCYSQVASPDAMTGRLRGHADAWRDIVGLSDEQTADLVRSDRIDILVDLKMHTADNRLLVFARKPAPVQLTWLGYPGTTGLSTIDYRLTDPYLDPPGLFDAFYAEESLRLPETFWCYDPLTDGPSVNALPALESGAITFGCLNNFCKINDGCLALWARVLRAVPTSRLLLRAPRGSARDRVLASLGRDGIDPARVVFADKRSRPEYLKLYHQIDLGLDPLPYNGHTTSLDAFWMGVPTLTMLGKTVVGRAGWSQLCNLHLEELAAETPEQFVALAAELAGDLPRLQELRGTLRRRMSQSPLMDAGRFASHLEQAYRQMWRRWCRGLSDEK